MESDHELDVSTSKGVLMLTLTDCLFIVSLYREVVAERLMFTKTWFVHKDVCIYYIQ